MSGHGDYLLQNPFGLQDSRAFFGAHDVPNQCPLSDSAGGEELHILLRPDGSSLVVYVVEIAQRNQQICVEKQTHDLIFVKQGTNIRRCHYFPGGKNREAGCRTTWVHLAWVSAENEFANDLPQTQFSLPGDNLRYVIGLGCQIDRCPHDDIIAS